MVRKPGSKAYSIANLHVQSRENPSHNKCWSVRWPLDERSCFKSTATFVLIFKELQIQSSTHGVQANFLEYFSLSESNSLEAVELKI